MEVCDDCRKEYPGPAYYTFEGCIEKIGDGPDHAHPHCTMNMCPACAGPYLEPDNPADPRRPIE